MVEPTGYRIESLKLNDLLNENFIKKIDENDIKAELISIIFVCSDDEKKIFPVVLGHKNSDEVKNKIINLESPEVKILTKMLKILKEMGGK